MEGKNTSIQPPLGDKIQSIRKLLRSSDPTGSIEVTQKDWTRLRSKYGNTINKWKWRSSKIRRNRFLQGLPLRSLPTYQNLAKISSEEFNGGFQLYSEDALLLRVRKIREYTKLLFLRWDLGAINPLTLSSKGWTTVENGFAPIGSVSLNFVCLCCHKRLTIGVTSGENEETMSDSHLPNCPWRKNVFDLKSRYYFNSLNVANEIEYIKGCSRNISTDSGHTIAAYDLFKQIHRLKNSSEIDTLLKLLNSNEDNLLALSIHLQGYEVVEGNILRCRGCFTYSNTNKLLNRVAHIHTHTPWCKYYKKDVLPRLILDLVPRELADIENDTLQIRLQKLINYVYKM